MADARGVQALRWRVACGLPIDHEGFHPTTFDGVV
jgi:hypothetical protein